MNAQLPRMTSSSYGGPLIVYLLSGLSEAWTWPSLCHHYREVAWYSALCFKIEVNLTPLTLARFGVFLFLSLIFTMGITHYPREFWNVYYIRF